MQLRLLYSGRIVDNQPAKCFLGSILTKSPKFFLKTFKKITLLRMFLARFGETISMQDQKELSKLEINIKILQYIGHERNIEVEMLDVEEAGESQRVLLWLVTTGFTLD